MVLKGGTPEGGSTRRKRFGNRDAKEVSVLSKPSRVLNKIDQMTRSNKWIGSRIDQQPLSTCFLDDTRFQKNLTRRRGWANGSLWPVNVTAAGKRPINKPVLSRLCLTKQAQQRFLKASSRDRVSPVFAKGCFPRRFSLVIFSSPTLFPMITAAL